MPKSDALPSLLYQLQSAAHNARIDFRSLKVNGSPAGATAVTPAASTAAAANANPGGSTAPNAAAPAASSATATQAAAATLPPGATVGSAGFPTMPFSFVFSGSFFDMETFLHDVQRFVHVRGQDVDVSGTPAERRRLLAHRRPRRLPERQGHRQRHRLRAARPATGLRRRAAAAGTRRGTSTAPAPTTAGSGRDRLGGGPMNAVRGLLRDLVERRLWPVAVLLLAAAVGDPDLHRPDVRGRRSRRGACGQPAGERRQDVQGGRQHRGSRRRRRSPRRRAQPLQAAPRAQAGDDQARLSDRRHDPRRGWLRRRGQRRRLSLRSTPRAAPAARAAPATAAPRAPAAAPPAAIPLDVYHLTLRFGEAGHLKTLRDVARLSPLPSADNPFFVYTGVLKDGKTAVFLLSSDAEATGDGHCRPSAKSCQTIEVKQGDTEFFDLTVNDEPVQYQLDVVKVFKKGASSSAAAAAAYERHSNAGSNMLRRAHRIGSSAFKGQASYRWLPESGVLVRAPKRGNARASVNGAAAASPADATGALPGLPVWAWDL